MTEQEYNQLEELNDVMYTLDYDMSDIKNVKEFKNKLERLSKIVDNLLLMPTGDFVETINTFDKRHFGDLHEE